MIAHGPLPDDPPAELGLSVEARQALVELRADPLQVVDGDRTFDDAVRGIRSGALRSRLDEIENRMSLASAEEQEPLLREKQSIVSRLQGLDAPERRLGWRDTRQGRKGRKRPSPGGNR